MCIAWLLSIFKIGDVRGLFWATLDADFIRIEWSLEVRLRSLSFDSLILTGVPVSFCFSHLGLTVTTTL